MSDTVEQKKSRRGLLALVGAGGAAAVAALLGRSDGVEAAPLYGDSSTSTPAIHGENSAGGPGVRGDSSTGRGVEGLSATGYGVDGVSGSSAGVKGLGWPGVHGVGKPGVFGQCSVVDGAGVKGEADGPGTIGVLAKNHPTRKALVTEGRVKMDCARKVTLSSKNNLVKLPSGVRAGGNAIVLAVVQGSPGNQAFVRRAFRVDSDHIRIDFDKKPANPTAVGYWVVHTG